MTGKGDFLNCSYDEVGNTDIYGCVDILKDSITCYCASISIQIAFSKSFNFLEVFLIWHKNMLFAYAADHAVLNNIFWVSVWKKTSSLRQQVCKNIFCMVDLCMGGPKVCSKTKEEEVPQCYLNWVEKELTETLFLLLWIWSS